MTSPNGRSGRRAFLLLVVATLVPLMAVEAAQASTTIVTSASPQSAHIGTTLTDVATLTGTSGVVGGTVSFSLFSDSLCARAPVFQSVNPVSPGSGSATAVSSPYAPVASGVYHWVATYSGDANNPPAGPTACQDPQEQVAVSTAVPAIATSAAPAFAPLGTPIHDTATISGAVNPTGTVTFQLYSDAACTTTVFTSVNPYFPPGATSGIFTATTPGTYHWVATYSGDANNSPAGPTACLDPQEQVVVARATPVITTAASPASARVGTPISDTATVSGLVNPTGGSTVTFQLYSDPACTVQVFLSTNPLDLATGTAVSGVFTPVAAGTYHWVATYSGDANNSAAGPTACSDPAETVTVLQGGNYTALAPTRIEDTRLGTGGLSGPLGPGATAQVQVAGRGGVPEGATAVVMNVTVTQPSAPGFLTVYPSGSPLPSTSNLNFTPGQTVPNLVVVKLGPGGGVALFNSAGSTHVILDVAGYFSEAGGNAGRYQPVVPARIADTRIGSGGVRLGPGQSFDLQVAGQGGAPATGIQAAVLNVAVTNTTAVSFLTVYPTGEPRPVASNLNFGPGDTVANRTMTKLGAGGRVTVYNQAGSTDVIVDLGGTYTDASVAGVTGTYTPLTPSRIVDTRSGTGANLGPVPSGGTIDVQVTGRGGVPSTGVRAVILNVTATQPAAMGYLTLFPAGAPRPNASDLNFAAGETRPNLVVVQVGTLGRVSLYSSAQTQVVVDVAGWFT